jgi:SNF2 family DNA or RNA helicase
LLLWCNTNYEADEIKKHVPYAVEVRGSDSEAKKESMLLGFSDGSVRVLLTKPSIAGMGLNFQVCSKQIWAGLGFSFEDYYQAVRRCWRFGQQKPVDVHIVFTDAEQSIEKTIARKESDHSLMQTGMASAAQFLTDSRVRDKYQPTKKLELPKWIQR